MISPPKLECFHQIEGKRQFGLGAIIAQAKQSKASF
jgi:hypothetical protein